MSTFRNAEHTVRKCRCGSSADTAAPICDVGFTPESGHWTAFLARPLWAINDKVHRSKIPH